MSVAVHALPDESVDSFAGALRRLRLEARGDASELAGARILRGYMPLSAARGLRMGPRLDRAIVVSDTRRGRRRSCDFPREGDVMFRLWERCGAGLGVLGIVLWVIAFAVAGGSPSSDDSNAKIVSYYSSSSHQNSQFIGFFAFVAGVACLIGFLSVLRERLSQAEGARGSISTLAFGSGLVSVAFWMCGVVFLVAPGFLASDTGASTIGPATFRMFNDGGFAFWVAGAIVGSVTVWSTSALALRTGVLPRWFGWLGILLGVVQLFAILFLPALVFWAWLLMASALLTWKRTPVTPLAPA
jgi:hypothetical protein